MFTCQKKIFLPFPDSHDVVSQSLNARENRNGKDLSGPNLLAVFMDRYESQQFSCTKFNPKFIYGYQLMMPRMSLLV